MLFASISNTAAPFVWTLIYSFICCNWLIKELPIFVKFAKTSALNSCPVSVPFLYLLNVSENLRFQGVKKWNIGWKWVNKCHQESFPDLVTIIHIVQIKAWKNTIELNKIKHSAIRPLKQKDIRKLSRCLTVKSQHWDHVDKLPPELSLNPSGIPAWKTDQISYAQINT